MKAARKYLYHHAEAEAKSTALPRPKATRTKAQLLAILDSVQRSGFGDEYIPAIQVRRSTAPMSSHANRLLCQKSGRTLHLLSDLEYHVALVAMYLPQVVEIQEQRFVSPVPARHPIVGHPLWLPTVVPDSPGSALIAQEASPSIRHPMCSDIREYWPLTTDLLLFVRAGESVRCVAWTCKPRGRMYAEEPNVRMLEKLEIERRLYRVLGIPYLILSPEDFPAIAIKNLIDLSCCQARPAALCEETAWQRFLDWATPRVAEYALVELWRIAAAKMHVDIDSARDATFHAVWSRQIPANMLVRIHPERALPQGGEDIGRTWADQYLPEAS